MLVAELAAHESRTARKVAAREWLVAVVVICGLTVFLMRGWLFGGGLPTSSRREVLTELSIVWLCREEMSQGSILSDWNPYWFSGFPWLRFLSYPIYYAVAAASLWGGIALENAMVAFFVIVMTASGITMYGFLRRVTGNARAAMVGAIVYMASPYHNHVGVETWIHAAFWALFPLMLWTVELSRSRGLRRTNYVLLTGVILGLFPVVSSEYALFATPFALLYITWRELGDVLSKRRPLLDAVTSFALIGATAAGVSAFFTLPGLLETGYVGIEAKHAGQSTFTNELLRNYAVTPQLVWYAITKRFGMAYSGDGLPGIASSFWSVSWYPGIVATVLALCSIGRLRDSIVSRYAALGMLIAMLVAVGPVLNANVASQIPIFGRLSPFRVSLLMVLFGAILAACGWQWVERVCTLSWLRWGAVFCALALVVVDYAPSAGAYQTTESYFSEAEQEAYSWLAATDVPGRVWDSSDLPRDQYLRSYSLSLLPRFRHIGYYDNGAALYTWQQFAWTDLSTVLHLHQVRFVIVRTGDQGAADRQDALQSSGYTCVHQVGDVRIWENQGNACYATLYGQTALDETQDFYQSFEVLPALVARNIALVSRTDGAATSVGQSDVAFDYVVDPRDGAAGQSAQDSSTSQGCRITADDVESLIAAPLADAAVWTKRWDYGEITLQAQSLTPALLTISESWYPHWRVAVDGEPQELLRVNWALMGVWLDPGLHQVSFYYKRPWYVYAGYAITSVVVLALLAWWTWYVGRITRVVAVPVDRALYGDGA